MATTKLMSIRLREDALDAIERIVERERYYKKSDVINNILRAVLTKFTPQEIRDMVHIYRWEGNKVETTFNPTSELEPSKFNV